MSIMRQARNAIAGALVAAGISAGSPAMADDLDQSAPQQDTTAEYKVAEVDYSTAAASQQHASADYIVPPAPSMHDRVPSILRSTVDPQIIRDQAANERFLPVKIPEKAVTLSAFQAFREKEFRAGKALTIIGVVVDPTQPHTLEHADNVVRHVEDLLRGRAESRADGHGYAELYGGCLLYTSPSPRD